MVWETVGQLFQRFLLLDVVVEYECINSLYAGYFSFCGKSASIFLKSGLSWKFSPMVSQEMSSQWIDNTVKPV